MFSHDVDDKTLNRKLNRLSQIYRLPAILNDKLTVINSSTDIDTYQSLILPTHAVSMGSSNTNYNELSNLDYLDSNSNDLLISNDNLNLTNANLLSTDNNLNISTNNLLNNGKKRNIVLIGHGISNNGGIPINNLSKIPSYQWGFKHEDDLSNNQLSNSQSNKGKNILSGLGPGDENSVSSLAGNLPNANSMALNSRLIRLPLKNYNLSNVNSYDVNNTLKLKLKLKNSSNLINQGGIARSLMNGLPYYDKILIDEEIRNLNLIKKENWKASNTNTSWFSELMNETVDDIEYLHGLVILNQFLNNKRIIRDYQWIMYWNEKLGGKDLIELSENNKNNNSNNGKILSLAKYEKLINKRHEKFKQLQIEKSMLRQEITKLNILKEEKRKAYILQFGNIPEKLDEIKNKQIYGDEIINKEKELTRKEFEIPEYEEEIIITDNEVEDDNTNANANANAINQFKPHLNRFIDQESDFFKEKEIIIEKEVSIDDPSLIKIENKLAGIHKNGKLYNEAARNKNGIITSKIVKMKRRPNPNALGFSNIKRRKPSFM